jgi:endoglucanase Acf2
MMHKLVVFILSVSLVLTLSACNKTDIPDDTENPISCDTGYHEENGICVEDEVVPVSCLDGYELIDDQCYPLDDFEVGNGLNTLGEGSYYNGYLSDFNHPTGPAFLDPFLQNTAIPSSGWWTSLLVANYGGSNGIYTNPLRVSYTNEGMEITNPEDGFVQYWNVDGNQTIAQYPIALKDTFLKSSGLNAGYETKVIGYGDAHVQVAMRNVGSSTNQMVTTLVQGSPYVFVEVQPGDTLTYTFDVNGVAGYEYYDLEGNPVTTSYTGNAFIVKLVQRHSGYNTSPPANVLDAQYSDKFYLINTPDNTAFTVTSNNHPFGLNNQVQLSLGDGDYLSIAAINTMDEAAFYHEHGYAFITDTDISFAIDYASNIVTTSYDYTVHKMDDTNNASALIALMPHHYKYSDATPSSYSYRTVRGTLKIFEGNSFTTSLSFNGLLPGFTLPTNDDFSSVTAVEYLEDLNNRIDTTDPDDFINYEGPYWNSKAMYPLAQGIIIADQLGEHTLRDQLIVKLKYVLEDWFTYSDSSDQKFLFYDNTWGSVYYSNDDFGTASQLSDHSFTHGYFIYASSVLAMYDQTFVTEYGSMVDFLLDDYMYPYKNGANFEYLRNFDPFAGHTWAHGFGTFAEGNNLESTSEALNSWNGGYLWALVTNNQDRMDAAIYGFVTELSAIKEYWFDYDDTNWDPAFGDYVDVAGMVWGGKHDYATWFGANPTFIYGIQWLPTGEYLTNYAMNEEEFNKLSSIYQTYLDAKGGSVDTWYSNMWAIQSIIDADTALSLFDKDKILNDDYPNELIGSYWMIHSMASLQQRTSDVWMGIHNTVAASVYETSDGIYEAMIWNPSQQSQTIQFYNNTGLLFTYVVSANTFDRIQIN